MRTMLMISRRAPSTPAASLPTISMRGEPAAIAAARGRYTETELSSESLRNLERRVM